MINPKTRFVLGIAIALLLAGVQTASAGFVVFDQPPVPLGQVFDLWASDNNVLNGNSIVRDNFSLSNSTAISAVGWWGGWTNVDSLVGAPSDALSWEIGFWSDNAGVPGALIQALSLSLADVSVTSIGTSPWRNDPNLEVFEFHAVLPTAFAAVGATTYWLSIQELSPVDSQSVAFGWMQKDGADGISYQTFNGVDIPRTDRAFTLTSVPEPSSIVLMGTGLIAALPFLRRRFRR